MIKELQVIDKPQKNRRPDWLKVKLPSGEKFKEVLDTINEHKLNTVCSEARCPNIGECWGAGTATFMILGDVCTRSCSFCAVKTGRPPAELDYDEPRRVAEPARLLGIRHVVITSVNRAERKHGGAPIFAEVIRMLPAEGRAVEVITPDCRGQVPGMEEVFEARPVVFNHNVETVPRLYRRVRAQASYQRALDVLKRAKEFGLRTKSGIMVGL